MSKPTLEQISAALFAKAQTVAGLTTCSRELRAWNDVAPADQAALFHCEEDGEAPSPAVTPGGRSFAGTTQWTLPFSWYLYQHRQRTGDVLLATAMNTLLQACRDALAPTPGTLTQTLGGLVASCRIAGTIQRDGGVLGDQGVAVVPIEVRCFPAAN